MSFSADIKEELAKQECQARHCLIAEIAAIISFCGKVEISVDNCYCIKINTENRLVARKYFTLLKKTFNIDIDVSIRQGTKVYRNAMYSVWVNDHEDAMRILQATKLIDKNGDIGENLSVLKNIVIQQSCCKRAFLRGAFLAAGSMSDPEKFYHYEIACHTSEKAEQIKLLLASFQLDAKIILRKKYHVVYLKEGNQIVDVLNVMDAPIALMELENIRILKEMRNSVNRKVNCETANINKTDQAAVKQVEDITYIKENLGFHQLPGNLSEIAELRLAKPDATLKELGESLEPPVGKSGVNHRLRKLSGIAEKLKDGKFGL